MKENDKIFTEEPEMQLSHANLPSIAGLPEAPIPEVQPTEPVLQPAKNVPTRLPKRKVHRKAHGAPSTDLFTVNPNASYEDENLFWEMPPLVKPSASSLLPHRQAVHQAVVQNWMQQSHNFSSEKEGHRDEAGQLIFSEADNLINRFYPASRPTSGVPTVRGLSPAASTAFRPDQLAQAYGQQRPSKPPAKRPSYGDPFTAQLKRIFGNR
jgi:hypothetical protein